MHASKYGAPGTGVRSNSPMRRPNIRGPNPSVSACSRTEQNSVRTEQNRTEQNRTEQNRTEQNRTQHNSVRTEQNTTEQNREHSTSYS